MLTAHNFKPAQDSGSVWHFSAVSKDPAPDGVASSKKTQGIFVPNPDQQRGLASLNATQAAYDSASRELKSARWELFAQWWNFCADGTLAARKGISTVTSETRAQAQLVSALNGITQSLGSSIQEALKLWWTQLPERAWLKKRVSLLSASRTTRQFLFPASRIRGRSTGSRIFESGWTRRSVPNLSPYPCLPAGLASGMWSQKTFPSDFHWGSRMPPPCSWPNSLTNTRKTPPLTLGWNSHLRSSQFTTIT